MSEYHFVVLNWAGRAKPAGLSFLIINLGVPWTLRINQCSRGIVLNVQWSSSLEGDCHIKNGATSEVVPSLKEYYLSSTSFLTALSNSNLICSA